MEFEQINGLDEDLADDEEQQLLSSDNGADDASISIGSLNSDTAIFAEEEITGPSREEKAKIPGRRSHQTQDEVNVEKDFCNEVHAKLNKLVNVLRGGAEVSDQILNTKDLLRLFSVIITEDSDDRAPPSVRRVGERLLLSPAVNIVQRVILPLYKSPHDELIELAILLTQKLSECPPPDFAIIYPPHELQKYNMDLRIFKKQLNEETILTTWSTYCAKIVDDLSRGGMTEEIKAKKTRIQNRLDKIKANEIYTVMPEDIELELIPDKAVVGSSIKGAVWHTTGQRRLADLAALTRAKKSTISRVLMALKQLILNFLRIALPPTDMNDNMTSVIPWQGSEEDLEFVRMLFSHNLVDLFQKEQHLLIEDEAYLREKRKHDRRDEFDNHLGSDDSLLIRNLEFHYQILRYVSPLALSVPSTERLVNVASSQFPVFGSQCSSHGSIQQLGEVKIARFSLDASASLLRQQGKINHIAPSWCQRGDRQRFTKLIGMVHKELRSEQIEFGEIQYGATDIFQLLGESWDDKESLKILKDSSKIYWQKWSQVAIASFCDYINDYTSSALEKFWNAWIRDIENQTTEIDVSPAVISRLISIMSWTLIYTYGITAQLLIELKFTTEHCLSTYYKRIEENIGRLCYWSRLGFQTKTMTFINSRLTRELRKPAKERSHTLLRATTRLMVLQNAWAKLLFESQHVVKGAEGGGGGSTSRLKDVGRNLYIHIAKNQSCALIIRLLQNYTTANAELELLLYALLSVDQLDQASRQISTVASKTKKIYARRGNKFIDMSLDPRVAGDGEEPQQINNIMSSFRPIITSPKTLTKLLFLASKSDLFPLAIKRAVFNLLNNLASTDVGRCIAWDLQRIELLNSIACSKEPLAKNIQAIIMESIKLLADCGAKNQFVVVEVLFGTWLVQGEYSLRDIINNYKLIKDSGGGIKSNGSTTAWTMSQTRAMMNAYEKSKYTGGRSVLRQIRLDVDSEDVEDAVRRFNLVDPSFLGDDHSPHIEFDKALADWLLTSSDSSPELLEGLQFSDIIKPPYEDLFSHILTKIRPIIARNGGKLDDLCVGMAVTTLLSEIIRWEIDQRYENMDDDASAAGASAAGASAAGASAASASAAGSAPAASAASASAGGCQDFLKKVTRHLYGICNMRKHRINPFTIAPEVADGPSEFDERKPKWVRDSILMILLMIHCDPRSFDPFILTPLNTLELRTHLASMAVSRPLADLESKVLDIQKNQQAQLAIRSSDALRIFKRSCRLIRELGYLLADVKDIALKLIYKLEIFCASKDTLWDTFNLGQHHGGGEEEEEDALLGAAAGEQLSDPWSTKSQWNLEELTEGLFLPNLRGLSDSSSASYKKVEHLGPLGTSLEYQAWLHAIGGISNALANPTHWEWSTAKITRVKLAKYLLLARFAIQVLNMDNLDNLCKMISRCEGEIEIWRTLLDPLAAEEIDESLFTDEKINYKLIGLEKKKSRSDAKENNGRNEDQNQPAAAQRVEEEPVAPLLKKKKLIIKRKHAPKYDMPSVTSILAIEDGIITSDEEADVDEENDVDEAIDECQRRMAQEFEELNKSPLVQKPIYDPTVEENAKMQSLIWQDEDFDLFSGALSLLAD